MALLSLRIGRLIPNNLLRAAFQGPKQPSSRLKDTYKCYCMNSSGAVSSSLDRMEQGLSWLATPAMVATWCAAFAILSVYSLNSINIMNMDHEGVCRALFAGKYIDHAS